MNDGVQLVVQPPGLEMRPFLSFLLLLLDFIVAVLAVLIVYVGVELGGLLLDDRQVGLHVVILLLEDVYRRLTDEGQLVVRLLRRNRTVHPLLVIDVLHDGGQQVLGTAVAQLRNY